MSAWHDLADRFAALQPAEAEQPEPMTAAQVAAVLGCDVSRVYQIERAALAKLRRELER